MTASPTLIPPEDQKVAAALQVYKDRDDPSSLQKWQLMEPQDTVPKALKVYQGKRTDQGIKKLWIINKSDGSRSYLVEFRRGQNEKVLFSPDEDFFYYVGLNDRDEETVFGINLATQHKFVVDQAHDFDVLRCQDSQSYVVIHDLNRQTHLIYQSNGKPMDMIKGQLTREEIQKDICGQIQKGAR